MWMDHAPSEIGASLLSVLSGILDLRAAYARFDGADGSDAIEAWWPAGPGPSPEVVGERAAGASDFAALSVESAGPLRVASVPLTLPWETALVRVSSDRADFPTEMETHLLRIAVGQAVIAFHNARRLMHEQAARRAAEVELHRSAGLIRTLVEELEPALSSISGRIRDAVRELAESDVADAASPARESDPAPAASGVSSRAGVPASSLSRRETEVLGLLAQGLSNKEIAGVLWLSDRTVERHITSLYRKIGVARRSEATAFALQHPSSGLARPALTD